MCNIFSLIKLDNSIIIGIVSIVVGTGTAYYFYHRGKAAIKALNKDVQTLIERLGETDKIIRKSAKTKEDEETLESYLNDIMELFNKHPQWGTEESNVVGEEGLETYLQRCHSCGGTTTEIATFPRPNLPKIASPIKVYKCSDCGDMHVRYAYS